MIMVTDWNNTTGDTSGAGTAYPSGAPKFTTVIFVLPDLYLFVYVS
jgi:hypothetical protein